MTKIGRNDRCPCGSGRKYKRCCLLKEDLPKAVSRKKTASRDTRPVLTLKRISEIDRATLRSTYFRKGMVASDAVFILRYDRFSGLRLKREGASFVISASIHRSPEGDVSFTTAGFDTPLEARCSCQPGVKNPVCSHSAFLALVLWANLHQCYDFELILPSIVERMRTIETALRHYFPGRTPIFEESSEAKRDEGPIRLVRILYCPGELKTLNGDPVAVDREFPEDLGPGILPSRGSLYPTPFHRHHASRMDLPFMLRQDFTGSSSLLTPEAKALIQSVQYEFSNGVVLTAGEILFHPFSGKVPDELLPLRENIGSEVWKWRNFQLIEGAAKNSWNGEEELTLVLLSILVNSEKAAGLSLGLASSMDRAQNRKLRPLGKFEIATKPSASWQLLAPSGEAAAGFGRVLLAFRPKSESALRIFRVFELDPASGALRFHSYLRTMEAVGRLLQKSSGNPFDETPLVSEVVLEGHDKTLGLISEVNDRLAALGAPPVDLRAVERVSASAVTPELWLEEEASGVRMRFGFSFATSQGRVQAWNLPACAQLMTSIVNLGMGAASHYENRVIAQGRRGEKRDRDLRVLKNSGLGALLFQEVVSSLLDSPSPKSREGDSASLKKRVRRAMDSLARMIVITEGGAQEGEPSNSAPVPFEKLCSKNIQQLVTEIVSALSESFYWETSPVFTPQGLIWVEGVAQAMMRLFQALVGASIAETRGAILTKSRTGALDSVFEGNSGGLDFVCGAEGARGPEVAGRYPITEPHRGKKAVLSALFPLAAQGFSIRWNGKPILEAEDGDLNAQFRILDTDQKIDWFELHPKVFFKGVEIDRSKLKTLASEGVMEFQGKYYLLKAKSLPAAKRLEDFWQLLQGGQKGEGAGSRKKARESHYLLPRNRTLELLALRASGAKIEGGNAWTEICRFYDSLDLSRELEALPSSLHAELKPYQRSGVQWLLDLHRLRMGGILADDMGLGKTLQTLAFLDKLRERFLAKKQPWRALIVVPTSLTYNWRSEAARFTPELSVEIFQPGRKNALADTLGAGDHSVLVVTYGLLVTQAEYFKQFPWEVLVFDEAQNLKNISTKRTTEARGIEARFKLCLTGTPLENHLGELYSLLDLVVPGSLGELTRFREKYVTPELVQPEEVRYLRLKIKPLVLRRTKSQILSELPSKTETRLVIPFEAAQQKLYRDIAISWNEKVKGSVLAYGEAKSQIMMLTALLRLRQACSDPSGIAGVRYSEEPPKFSILLESLEEITESGESALVFTQFLHTLERLSGALSKAGIAHFVIHGGTSRKERERLLGEFQNHPGGAVLLMTLKTGGVGLNLVKASYVFHLEPWWNPAVENQATDRAHRLGQTRPVQVFRYIMRESVEEKIERLKERKQARFDLVFSEAEGENALSSDGASEKSEKGGAFLSQEDFNYLLS